MSAYQSPIAETVGIRSLAAARAIAAAIAAPFAALARAARVRRTVGQLQDLDDRTLADIGLRRSQIVSTAVRSVDWPHVDPRDLAR